MNIDVPGFKTQSQIKLEYPDRTGRDSTACIGNGRNDVLMLKEAALGIAAIQGEGASSAAVMADDIVCTTVFDALDLFKNHRRITATLRD